MKKSFILGSVIIMMIGLLLGSCTDMERSNLFDPSNPNTKNVLTFTTTAPPNNNTMTSCGMINFMIHGGNSPYTFAIVDKTGSCNPSATPGAMDDFSLNGNCIGTGTCRVQVTDSLDNIGFTWKITITP